MMFPFADNRETAAELAGRGAAVTLACRNAQAAEEAAADIRCKHLASPGWAHSPCYLLLQCSDADVKVNMPSFFMPVDTHRGSLQPTADACERSACNVNIPMFNLRQNPQCSIRVQEP